MRFLIAGGVLAFLLFFGCIQVAQYEIILPHSGEKVNLSIISEKKGQYSELYAEKRTSSAYVSYSYSGGWSSGGSGGSAEKIHYSDSGIEYDYEESCGRLGCREKFNCARGSCGFPVLKNATLYDSYNHFKNNTLCFPNGTYETTTTTVNGPSKIVGQGCP